MKNVARGDGRCSLCRLRHALCVCGVIPRLRLSTRVIVLMHCRETRLTTNTAKLAPIALENCEIRLRGVKGRVMDDEGLVTPDRQPLYLFPSTDAVELNAELAAGFAKPLTLILPDGSWRQAKRVVRREPALAGVPRVKLPEGGGLSSYRLRREPNAQSVSTFEAIARALGIIEGQEVQRQLEYLFDVMVERLLWSRGLLPVAQCRHPIPTAAVEEFRIAGSRASN